MIDRTTEQINDRVNERTNDWVKQGMTEKMTTKTTWLFKMKGLTFQMKRWGVKEKLSVNIV